MGWRSLRTLTRASCGLLLLGWGAAVQAEPEGAAEESQLKAELVERFTRFVYWPENALNKRFQLCAYGRGRLESALRDVARSHRFKEQPTVFRRVAEPEQALGCNVLFVQRIAGSELEALLAVVDSLPILTLSDTPGFASRGVMVNFRRESDYLRFEINEASAQRSGLEISSRLLQLALPMVNEETAP